jgi:hypothetical protein
MRRHLLAAGIAAAALIPSFAFAQQTCEERHNTRVAGTLAGAGIGALIGSAVAGHDDRGTGAVIGAVGGGIIGNQVAKSNADCAHAYGYYDSNGRWHANAVDRASAAGYYDRGGNWVDGTPNGYYDGGGRWIAVSTTTSASGYYDSNGRWVPASANGYYNSDGQWIAGVASGYYDNGRWVAGPATGHYDSRGRWISGEVSGHRDANGVWIADAQSGYYDTNGRWRAGPAMGYYDTQGRWIATAPSADYHGSDVAYEGRSGWAGAPLDIRAREAWLDRRIRQGVSEGSLSRGDANRALRSLNNVRRQEMGMRHYQGRLSPNDQAYIQARLDTISRSLRWSSRDSERRY